VGEAVGGIRRFKRGVSGGPAKGGKFVGRITGGTSAKTVDCFREAAGGDVQATSQPGGKERVPHGKGKENRSLREGTGQSEETSEVKRKAQDRGV